MIYNYYLSVKINEKEKIETNVQLSKETCGYALVRGFSNPGGSQGREAHLRFQLRMRGTWDVSIALRVFGVNCTLPSHNPQKLRMWMYLESGSVSVIR